MPLPRLKPDTSEYKSEFLTPAPTVGRTFRTKNVDVHARFHEKSVFL
jgi:hypothetical protein